MSAVESALHEIGQALAEARLRRGLTLEDVQAETRIRTRYLAAMEDERFGDLPGEGYARCFLRSYADFLGLDRPATMVAFDLRFASAEPEVPVTQVRARRPRRWEPLGLLVLAVATASGVAALGWKLVDGPAPAATPPSLASGSEPQSPAPEPEPVAATTAPAVAPPALALTARAPCWIEVRIGGPRGKLVWTGTVTRRSHLRFGLRRPLWIRAGAPQALRATIGGEPASLPAGALNLVATVDGVRPAS